MRGTLVDVLTPPKHERAQPNGGAHALQDDVAWHLQENVGNKEHEESNIKSVPLWVHVQIFL